ncbi:MAG TPA: PAS domain S-box protein [Papillibacter sp.]|nr:PAS domain S-box protein [Papillibacter sp.]
MDQSAVYALVSNAALLVLLSVIYELTYYVFTRSRIKRVVNGFLVALTCIAIMSMSFELLPGVLFDARSIIISVTALLFEPVTTLIAVAAAIAYRVFQGGNGVMTGVIVILISALIGMIWRQWNSKEYRLRWFNIYIMGLFVHLAMIACMTLLPYPENIRVVEGIAAPVMLIFPVATVLLYLLLTKQKTFWKMRGELEQSEERFRMLFHKAPLAYQSLSSEGRIVEVNDRWLDTFGYEPEEVLGRFFCDFLSSADRDKYRRSFGTFKQQGTIHRELEVIHKSGRFITVSYDGEIVRDESGEFKQAYCILRDITEQKKAEIEVRQSEQKFRRLFETMSQGVVCQAANGQILSANREAQRILGLSLAELMGKTSEDSVWKTVREDGSEMPGYEHPSMVALRTGKPCGPVILGVFNPNLGTHIWLSVNATPIIEADGTMSQVYTIFQDITAEKKARQDYELLFNSMVDGFALHEIICDEEGKPTDYRFLAVNPAFEQIVGMKASEIVGKRVLEIMPGLQSYWIETYGKVALTGQSVRFEQYDAATDKHFRVMAYQPAPMQFACTFSDDTSRVKAEEKSQKTLARLRGLLDNSNSLIIVFNNKGVIVEVSAAVEQLFGKGRREMGGESMHKLGLFGILAKARRLSDYLASGRELSDVDVFEFEVGGEKRYFESRLFPIEMPDKDEQLFGYLGIDVTERIMAERALKLSEEKYSSYIENAPYAVFVLDENGNFLESNKAASLITGYDRDKILRMNIWDITAEEAMDETASHFKALLKTGKMSAELKYFHRDGHIRWWTVDAVKISENRFLTFSIDITDRKQAEADLINLNKRDYLTGVYNRRFFEAELQRMDEEKLYPLSVIIGDINGVKFINDAFGHAEGESTSRRRP